MMNLRDARREFLNNRPWSIDLEFRGYNPNNASGQSAKWWQARGDGGSEAYINWGKIGGSGRAAPLSKRAIQILYDIVEQKIKEGYKVVETKLVSKPIPVELSSLPEPYCLIRKLVLREKNFWSYDEKGEFLLEFEKEGADLIIKKGQFVRFQDTWSL